MSSYEERNECWKDTKNKIKMMSKVDDSVKRVYKNENFTKKYSMSNVRLIDFDVIDCAIKCKKMNPVIYNYSENDRPGRFVNSGLRGEEEESFRRTNYSESLLQNLYPIFKDEGVYSPNISVIKMSEATKWKSIPENEVPKISFIACSKLEPLVTYVSKHNQIKLHSKDVEILKNQIKLIIQIAVEYGHDTIIFGSLFSGERSTPIKHIAEIFKSVLIECNGVILNYYFAMLSNEKKYELCGKEWSTIEIFSDVFGIPVSLFKNY